MVDFTKKVQKHAQGFEAGKLVSAMTLQFTDGSAVTVDLLKGGGDPGRFAAALGLTAA